MIMLANFLGITQVYRGACTDSKWQTSDCPQYCNDSEFFLSPRKKGKGISRTNLKMQISRTRT